MLTNGSRLARQLWMALLCVGVIALLGAVPAQAKGGKGKGSGKNRAGFAFTQTNDPSGNQVVVYRRAANGTLTEADRVATGGVGAASTPPFGFPIVDSQGSLELTKNGRLLFAVNAGDDTISSFRVKNRGIRLIDRKPSGGDLPVSLDSQRHLLYVVNSLSGDISGLRFTKRGRMTPIAGSTQPLSPAGGNSAAAQIGFAKHRRVLTVSLRNANVIDTFKVAKNGKAGPATASPSNAPVPFGFEYRDARTLIGSNVGDPGNPPNPMDPSKFHGSASSYRLNKNGTLTPIDNKSSAPAGTENSDGRATCWVVITNDKKYTFMTNTLSRSISRFRIAHDGTLTLLGTTATGPGFASDEALSRNGKYLYVLLPSIMGGTSHIDVYRVRSGGRLTHIQTTPSNLPPAVSGMVAR